MNRAFRLAGTTGPVSVGARAAVLSLVLSPLAAPPADACSCLAPEHWGFLGPEASRLPANSAGVLYHKPSWSIENPRFWLVSRLEVEIEVEGAFQELTVSVKAVPGFRDIFIVSPAEGLRPGFRYRFTDHSDEWTELADLRHGFRGYRQVLATVDSGTLTPTTQLSLGLQSAAIETLTMLTLGGSCSVTQRTPHVVAEARLDGVAKRWKAALLYRTLVDKEVWHGGRSLCDHVAPGRSSRELGYDIVYSYCKDAVGWGSPTGFGVGGRRRTLQPGTHTVTMQAYLPGADIVLETETMTIDLSCPVTNE